LLSLIHFEPMGKNREKNSANPPNEIDLQFGREVETD